jgi:hypothetical protein
MKNLSLRGGAVLAVLVIVFALPGCKKSGGSGNSGGNGSGGTGSGYYMKFKLNGVAVEFDSQPFAGISYNKQDSLYTCVLTAYKDVNAGLKNAITVTLFSNNAIAAGVGYNDPAKARAANGTITPQNTVFYYDSTAIGFLTMGLFADANGNILLTGIVADARLTITEMTAAYVKGTFSGTVYKSSTLMQYYTITEGTFYLKRS